MTRRCLARIAESDPQVLISLILMRMPGTEKRHLADQL
jgi:hypothetical protein